MGLFEDIAHWGGRLQGEAAAFTLAAQRTITGNVGITDGWSEFQRLRPMGQNVGHALTQGAMDEMDDPQHVPTFAVQIPRVVRGGVNLTGGALDLAGSIGDSANLLGGSLSNVADLNDATRGWLLPVAVIAGGAVIYTATR